MFKCYNCGAEKPTENAECRFCGLSGEDKKTFAKIENQEKSSEIAGVYKTILSNIYLMNIDSLLKMGLVYFGGAMSERNIKMAKCLFEEAANRGNDEGMFYYGKTLLELNDEENGLWWLMQAAKLGNVSAQMTLATKFKDKIEIRSEEKVLKGDTELKKLVGKIKPFCVELTCVSSSVDACSGSGCIISSKYIITNAHVIFSNRTKKVYNEIIVNFSKSLNLPNRYLDVVFYDMKEDIALCQFRGGEIDKNADFPKLVDSHCLECGEKLFTIGNALGQGLALSTGVLSREIMKDAFGKKEVLQSDMSINGGNSGGALFDVNGNIVGLMTFTPLLEQNNGRAYGISFAITSNTIAELIKKNSIDF